MRFYSYHYHIRSSPHGIEVRIAAAHAHVPYATTWTLRHWLCWLWRSWCHPTRPAIYCAQPRAYMRLYQGYSGHSYVRPHLWVHVSAFLIHLMRFGFLRSTEDREWFPKDAFLNKGRYTIYSVVPWRKNTKNVFYMWLCRPGESLMWYDF